MIELKFEKCPISGQQAAQGVNGIYWVNELDLSYVSLMSVDKMGPKLSTLGTFQTFDDAVVFINKYDDKYDG